MNYMNIILQIIALTVAIVSIKLYFEHRKSNYKGIYTGEFIYKNVNKVTHDTMRSLWINLFFFMVIGLEEGEKFFDPNDFFGSWVGKVFIIILGFFTFNELIYPHVLTKIHIL